MIPDALVVGAGPAGAIAALVLARAGVRVRLIERARFPRDKLCGDTLNPGSLGLLDRLDAALGRRVRRDAAAIRGMLVTGSAGAAVAADYPDGISGVALTRRNLDAELLEAAIAAGAEFASCTPAVAALADGAGRVTGVRVRTASGEVDMRAAVTIAADGRRSTLAFGLGLARFAARPRRWAFGTYFTGVEALTSRGEMHIRPDGYIGVAPLADGLANVCVVQTVDQARSRVRRQPDVSGPAGFSRTVIDRAIAGDPMLRERFAHARQVSPVTALGPLAVDARAAGCPGLLLAGDAAGFVDPMTGDGLRFALRGGELAAEAALQELATGVPMFHGLARARRDEFTGKWRVNRALRGLVASPRGVALASRIGSRWQWPVTRLVAIAGDVGLVHEWEAA